MEKRLIELGWGGGEKRIEVGWAMIEAEGSTALLLLPPRTQHAEMPPPPHSKQLRQVCAAALQMCCTAPALEAARTHPFTLAFTWAAARLHSLLQHYRAELVDLCLLT